MTTQESTEKVLRQLYLLLARGEASEDNPNKIIIDKKQAERLLNDLNKCIYDMLETYEMTSRSRDQAEREFRRQGERTVAEAQRRAEDVYAASIIYSEDSLNRISAIMRDASLTIEKLYQDMSEKLQDEEKVVRRNQTELRSQLHALKDTDQYLEKMKEWREEEERERRRDQNLRGRDTNLYANRRSEIKINYELLRKMNLEPVEEAEEMAAEEENNQLDLHQNMDGVKAEQNANSTEKDSKASSGEVTASDGNPENKQKSIEKKTENKTEDKIENKIENKIEKKKTEGKKTENKKTEGKKTESKKTEGKKTETDENLTKVQDTQTNISENSADKEQRKNGSQEDDSREKESIGGEKSTSGSEKTKILSEDGEEKKNEKRRKNGGHQKKHLQPNQ